MNEFDFQSGDFLDSLVTSSTYTSSDHSDIQNSIGQTTGATSYLNSSCEQNSTGETYCHVDNKPPEPFSPNFYKEIHCEGIINDTEAEYNEPTDDNESSEVREESKNEIEHSSQNSELIEESHIHQPEIEIAINNVVCSFAVRCHLNLKRVALEGANVIYKRENGMVSMKLRKPSVTASIWSSGKITCTGATSEEDSKKAARRIARILEKMEYRVKFCRFRVVNVLGTCSFPFGIRITRFSADHKEASYEPELHPGVTYKLKEPKATLKIFSTGSITVTAPSVANVQLAIEHIYPLVSKYRMEDKEMQSDNIVNSKMHFLPNKRGRPTPRHYRRDDNSDDDYDSEMDTSDTSEEDYS